MRTKLQTYFKKPVRQSKRFKAYALIYALMILVLISIFTTIYLNLYYSNEQRLAMVFMQQDLRRDTKLALVNGLKEGVIKSGNYVYKQEPLSQFTFEVSEWGLFNLVRAIGERQTFKETYSVLTGFEIQTPESPSLYFENSDPLKIGGGTHITKKAIVPKRGVERAYISSSGTGRIKLVDGEIIKLSRKSKKLLSELDVLNYKPSLKSDIESAKIIQYQPGENYYNHFSNEVMLLDVGENTTINSHIEGRIKIIGEDSILISNEANLKNIQVIAPKIRIQSHFKGEVQCFAEQYIHVEKEVNLNYPSVLFLSTDSLNSGIVLEKSAIVEGVVIGTSSVNRRNLNPQIEFRKGSRIVGQVITNLMNTQLSGEVYGHVFLNTIFLKTKSSIYTNHLLDTEINIDKLPKYRYGISIEDYTGQQRIMSWIEHKTL